MYNIAEVIVYFLPILIIKKVFNIFLIFVSKFQKILNSDMIKEFKSKTEKLGAEQWEEEEKAVQLLEKKMEAQYEIPEYEE